MDLIGWKRLGEVKDQVDFLVRTYMALAIKDPRKHAVLRRVRAA